MDPIKETAATTETKAAGDNLPEATNAATSHVAAGTEGAAHTGLIEPHSPAANALPNGGASGVSLGALTTVGTMEHNVLETTLPLTAEAISVNENAPLPKNQHPNDVKFKVKYAANFKGDKGFPEGSVQVISKESAEQFAKAGIGSIVK